MNGLSGLVMLALAATGASALIAGDPLWWVGFLTDMAATFCDSFTSHIHIN